MAIIKFINSKPTLETLINYVTKESKVFAVEGKDCLSESVLDEMKSVKKAFQKEDESEFVNLIKQQLTPELDEQMKTRARDMKVVFAIMHINFCSMAEFADKLQCSPVLIKALLCLDRNLSRKMLDKVAQLINIKGYDLLSLISEKWSSHYDVLIAIAQLCKNKQ